jgi:hypothetical protein
MFTLATRRERLASGGNPTSHAQGQGPLAKRAGGFSARRRRTPRRRIDPQIADASVRPAWQPWRAWRPARKDEGRGAKDEG